MFNLLLFNLAVERDDFYVVQDANGEYRMTAHPEPDAAKIPFPCLDREPLRAEFLRARDLPLPPVGVDREDYIWQISPECAWEWASHWRSRLLVETIKWCLQENVPFHYEIGLDVQGKRYPQAEEAYIRSEIKKLRQQYGPSDPRMAQFSEPKT